MQSPSQAIKTAVYATNPLRGEEHAKTQRMRQREQRAQANSPSGVVHYADGSFDITKHNKSRHGKKRRLRGGPHDLHLSQPELWAQREISRDLNRNSQLIIGATETLGLNVIHSGFSLGLPKRSTREAKNAALKQRKQWKTFSKHCHTRGLHHWDLQDLMEKTEVTDGDLFMYLNPDGNGGHGSVQPIEGDRVLTPQGCEDTATTRVWNGIRTNVFTGEIIEFFVARSAPMFNFCREEEGQWMPAFNRMDPGAGGIVMSCMPTRESSTRGEPWCAPAVREHDDIDAVLVAVRIALRQHANRSSYTKTANVEQLIAFLSQQSEITLEEMMQPPIEEIEPGEHYYLNPWEEMGVVENNMPSNNFKDFIETEFRMVGLGRIHLPIEMLMLNWSARNMSASRLAMEDARHNFKRRQKRVERYRVDPIFAFFVACGQRMRTVDQSEDAFDSRWRHPRWPYPEPVKDIKAQILAMKNKIKSLRTVREESGYDYDEEQEEIDAEEAELRLHDNNPNDDEDDDQPTDESDETTP